MKTLRDTITMHRFALTLPASGAQLLMAHGNFVYVRSSTEDMTLRAVGVDGALLIDNAVIRAAAAYRLETQLFRELHISGSAGASCEIFVGVGDVTLNLLSGAVTVAPPGTLSTLPDDSIAAGATELVSPANSARTSIIIGNLAGNASTIRVGDSNTGAARGQQVAPGQSIALDTSAAVYVYSPTLQSVSITELTG